MQRAAIGAGLLLLCVPAGLPAQSQKRDFLSAAEADKVRDAETPSERIKVFLEFADDRLKKFQYELVQGTKEARKKERLNYLLNSYTWCIDDAAELIDLGIEKQEDIGKGIKEMKTKTKEFLTYLEPLSTNGAERESYQDTLRDAIDATKDALKEAEQAEKEFSPPPVRRKQ